MGAGRGGDEVHGDVLLLGQVVQVQELSAQGFGGREMPGQGGFVDHQTVGRGGGGGVEPAERLGAGVGGERKVHRRFEPVERGGVGVGEVRVREYQGRVGPDLEGLTECLGDGGRPAGVEERGQVRRGPGVPEFTAGVQRPVEVAGDTETGVTAS